MRPNSVACDFKECSQCCTETKMPLLEEDIRRIEKLDTVAESFTENDGGFIILKNNNGACVFLEEGKCRIYSHRPTGCRLYPLVYDIDQDEVIIDLECPNRDAFVEYLKDEGINQILIDTVDRLIYERNARIMKNGKK